MFKNSLFNIKFPLKNGQKNNHSKTFSTTFALYFLMNIKNVFCALKLVNLLLCVDRSAPSSVQSIAYRTPERYYSIVIYKSNRIF